MPETFTKAQESALGVLIEKALGEYEFPVSLGDEDHRDIASRITPLFDKQVQAHLDRPKGINDQLREIAGSLEEKIKVAMKNGAFPADRVQSLIAEAKAEIIAEATKAAAASQPFRFVPPAGGKPKDLGRQHRQFPTLLALLQARLNVYVVGPAGAGKTVAASNAAKALDVPFHFTGAIASEYKLTGFIDAQGRIVSTEFRRAYEQGGLFLFDEIDASFPQAVLAFNAALANGWMDFPDKRVDRHDDFYCIAAANTYGTGADRQYVGRNQLDAASLDRFAFLDWSYDETLERALAGNDQWVNVVQTVRKMIVDLKIRHVVSPRASFYGAALLAAGDIPVENVAELTLWKGLDRCTKDKLLTPDVQKAISCAAKR